MILLALTRRHRAHVTASAGVDYVRIQQPSVASLITIKDAAISYTPTLLSAAGGGTWSATNLPTGASLNTSTGAITGTLTAYGRWITILTYTEGSLSDSVPVCIYVVDAITSVAGGSYSSSIKLDDNTYRAYRLTGNVTAAKTAFTFGKTGIVLDLNGYTVTYDNDAQPVSVANGDFASGDFTGWDTSGASGATVATGTIAGRTAFNDGEYATRIPLTTGTTKYLETTGNLSLVAGQTYAVTMCPLCAGTEGIAFNTVFTLGSHSSASLGASDSFSDALEWREGSFAIWRFVATITESVPLRVSVTNNSGTTQTFCLCRINADRAKCHGMVSRHGEMSDANRPYADVTATAHGVYHGVCNGTLTQAAGSPESCAFAFGSDPVIDGVTISTNPRVAAGLGSMIYYFSRGLVVTRSTISMSPTGIYSRDNGNGFLCGTHSVGDAVNPGIWIRDNTIEGSIQGGFLPNNPTPLAAQAGACSWNTATIQSRYTNGFSFVLGGRSGSSGVLVAAHNTTDLTAVATSSGRGFRGSNYIASSGNYAKVRVLPDNLEYGGYQLSGAYAMQLETDGTGVSFDTDAYETYGNGGGAAFRVNGAVATDLPIDNCTLIVNSTTATPAYDFSCIYLTWPDSGSMNLAKLLFDGCTLKTNRLLVKIDGSGWASTLTIANAHIWIVDDAYYNDVLFSVPSGALVHFSNPTYHDAFSETEFKARADADARVSYT